MTFINSVKGKILIGFILAVLVYIVFRGDVQNATNLSHFGIIAWLHVLAGIVWIGLLYYFNFVQTPAMGAIVADKESPAVIGKYIAPNALLWFRMAAATTWILGLVLLATYDNGIMNAFLLKDSFKVIGIGAWLGTIMAFNVWFIIWPNQQKILGIKSASDDEIATAKKNAALASSVNVILSIPMLLTMIAWH